MYSIVLININNVVFDDVSRLSGRHNIYKILLRKVSLNFVIAAPSATQVDKYIVDSIFCMTISNR